MFTFTDTKKQPELDADVLFLIDSSYEVSQEDLVREKDFIKSLVRSLNISSDSSRAALISYGDRGSISSRFIRLKNLTDFDRFVDNASYIGGERRIDKAVEMATRLLNEAGAASSKVVIFLTAGKQASSGKSLEDVVQPLRRHGTKTYVIAIGKQTDLQELKPLVISPEDVLTVQSFTELRTQENRVANLITERAGKRQNETNCFKGTYEVISSTLRSLFSVLSSTGFQNTNLFNAYRSYNFKEVRFGTNSKFYSS